jgi:hypothetical protein
VQQLFLPNQRTAYKCSKQNLVHTTTVHGSMKFAFSSYRACNERFMHSKRVRTGFKIGTSACLCMQDTLDTDQISVPELAGRLLVPTGNVNLFTNELDIVRADFCYNLLAPKWAGVLGGFDVYTRSHCVVAITSLRID